LNSAAIRDGNVQGELRTAVTLLHPLRLSNIPSAFSMHDALYNSVDWLLAGPDAGCISTLQLPCYAPSTSSHIAESLQEASMHLLHTYCTPPKNFSAASLKLGRGWGRRSQ